MTRRPSEKKSRDHASRVLAKIRKAHRRGRTRYADQATRTYLNSRDAKFVACLKAADALEKLGKPRPPKKVIEQIATTSPAWNGERLGVG